MAIPVPRSYPAILGGEIDTFLSQQGIPSIRVGSPILTFLEATAQSDLRTEQAIFGFLKSTSLANSTGNALIRLGTDEDLPKLQASNASGAVNVIDTSFAKVSSAIFGGSTVGSGSAGVVAGSANINIADGSGFPGTGNVYIGRGSINYEGPLAYTSVTNNGSYWTIALSGTTLNFHNASETVVLAQGGNRLVSASSQAQTSQGNAGNSIVFSTLYDVTLPDGENLLQGVGVAAVLPGLSGNVASGSINSWASAPFTGAGVTNPLPFVNGIPLESDDHYRERIRIARASKTQGTALAVTSGVIGIVSPDENKRVISSSLVSPYGGVATLFVDDGTGYEEISRGVAIEVLMDSASGGEQYFTVAAPPPVTKAFLTSTTVAPFALSEGSVLAVQVGEGAVGFHTFSATSFVNIGAASAYEVVASINSDPGLDFVAHTQGGGTRVTITARADTNEDIEVVSPSPDVDANDELGFSTLLVQTLHLYANDRLLSKDGLDASATSIEISGWGVFSGACVLTIAVDGTAAQTYTITANSFVSANTGFSTVGANTLAAWAAVFNAAVPGITTSVSGGNLILTSNLGATSRAAVAITATPAASNPSSYLDLVGIMFSAQLVNGASNDYTLNRNTGEIYLTVPLVAGDRLTAGSAWPRAFLQSSNLPVTIGATGNIWTVVDGATKIVPIANTPLNISVSSSPSWGDRVRYTQTTPPPTVAAAFGNVEVGDCAILWDPAFSAMGLTGANLGIYRVDTIDAGGTWFEVSRRSGAIAGADLAVNLNLPSAGLVIVRTTAQVQDIQLSAAKYGAYNFVSKAAVAGGFAGVYRTDAARVSTNTFSSNGDISIVTADAAGAAFGFPESDAVSNSNPNAAAVQSAASEIGTPRRFQIMEADAATGSSATVVLLDTLDSTSASQFTSSSKLVGLRDAPDDISSIFTTRFGNNYGFASSISTAPVYNTTRTMTLTLRQGVEVEWIPEDYVYEATTFANGPQDQLAVVVDGDVSSKRYVINTSRNVAPKAGTSYGSAITLQDLDSGSQHALGNVSSFGTAFNWNDFAVYMKARTNVDPSGTGATTILYRFYRFGPEGNEAQIRYVYPNAPSASIAVVTDTQSLIAPTTNISVALASGGERAGTGSSWTTLSSTTSSIGLACQDKANLSTVPYGLYQYTYILGYTIASISSAGSNPPGVVTMTLTLPPGIGHHGIRNGSTFWLKTAAGYTSGLYTVTSTSQSGGAGTVWDTISFTDSHAGDAGGSTTGNISVDTAQLDSFPATVVVGDVFASGAGLVGNGYVNKIIQLTNVDGAAVHQFIQGLSETDTDIDQPTGGHQVPNLDLTTGPNSESLPSSTTCPRWESLAGPPNTPTSAFVAYPLSGNSIATVASAVNALAAVTQSTVPVTAVALGSGGNITESTMDTNAPTSSSMAPAGFSFYDLSDGVNFVASTALSGSDYVFTLKDAVASALTTGSDYANERIKLAPITAQNFVDYLSAPTTSGLSNVAGISTSSRGHHLQINTLTPGSAGSIQVQGGTANSLSAPVQSGGTSDSHNIITSLRTSDCIGLVGGSWVAMQNTVTSDRATATQDWQSNGLSTPPFSLDGITLPGGTTPPFATVTSGGISLGIVTVTTSFANMPFVAGNQIVVASSEGNTETVTVTTGGTGSFTADFAMIHAVSASVSLVWVSAPGSALVSLDPADVGGFQQALAFASDQQSGSVGVTVNKHSGNITSYTADGINGAFTTTHAHEGDWVNITTGGLTAPTGIGLLDPANCGLFKVVRFDSPILVPTIWVENPNSVEGTGYGNFSGVFDGAILPGDLLKVNTTLWGASTLGQWTVQSVGSPPTQQTLTTTGVQFNPWMQQFFVINAPAAAGLQPITFASPGQSFPLPPAPPPPIQIYEGSPARLIKQVLSLGPNQIDGSLTDVHFVSFRGYSHCNSSLGTLVVCLDKLQFPTSLQQGLDSYAHSVGLIGESNLVEYGDEFDTATYPGIVALGANVNISGPYVKRIQISVSVRVNASTTNLKDITEAVQSAIASFINASPVGQPIALSDVVNAVRKVTGVTSVTIVSPAYGLGNDQISVQPQEKPLVINLAQDITVNFVG